MRASESSPREIATRIRGTIVPRGSPNRISPYGRAAKGLWPSKTAAEIAWRAAVSERAAKYWISGDREPSAVAVAIIVEEITNRSPRA